MARTPKFEGRPVWAEISLGALRHNLKAIRKHIGAKRKILAIVKANAYGHGAVGVARALEKAGADWFGVTCSSEGIELREAGIRKPILVLSGFWPGEEPRLLEHHLTPAITQLGQLPRLERAAARRRRKRPLPFHLKVDTGMNRLGIAPRDLDSFLRELAGCRHAQLEGTFTHFASAEAFTRDQTEQQEKLFDGVLAGLRAAGANPGIVHMANSAGVASRPGTWRNMVRPGAILYGYHQFYDPQEREAEAGITLPLEPVLSLRARIIVLRDVPAGQGIGYNARFVTERPSKIAVIAAGYADGLVRLRSKYPKSPAGRVVVRGRCAPLVGIISMDLAMVDVTDVAGASVGDVVTIYGRDGCSIQVNEVARELGTVTSDLLCAIGKRVPRFYLS